MFTKPSTHFKKAWANKSGHVPSGQNYSALYDAAFGYLLYVLDRPLRVLEVGVDDYRRGSSYAFRKMDYVEKYVGVDLRSYPKIDCPKTTFHCGNAYTHDMILELKQHGLFDVLIDDGSHKAADMIFFRKHYQQLANKPSVMCIEDLNCRYPFEVFEKEIPGMYVIKTTCNSELFFDRMLVYFNL